MSNTPTPRTDEFMSADCCDIEHCADFARQLERELARALKLAEDNGKLAHQTACELADAKEQRDNARKEAERFRNVIQDCKWPKHVFSWENKNQTS